MDSPVENAVGERRELRDATNVKNEAVAAQAAEHGWVTPADYDYKLYADNKQSSIRQQPEATADEEAGPTTDQVPVWASDAARYEWKEEFGDVGPTIPRLEKQLFGNPTGRGENMRALQLGVTVESEVSVPPITSFDDAGLHPVMLENVKLCRYETPTPIQAYCVPAILTNHDIIAVAQTGSGKTAAFLIPVLSKLMGKAKKLAAPRPDPTQFFDPRLNGVVAEPLVLIITPTRELSCQIFDEARRFCYRSMLRPCVAYGGGPAREQAYELKRGCDVLIGTPGRLIDFIERGNLLSLRRVKYTIIDEADELIGPDWMDDMKAIMSGGDNNEDADHRYMLFSATFPKEARALAKEYLDDSHVRIRVGRVGSTHLNIRQSVVRAEESEKREVLRKMLLELPPTRTIIFVNSKKSADYLDDYLYNCGFPSTSLHSDRTQREREDALRAFKSGKAPIMVATGVSARGLDIINIMHVVNYDLPSSDHGGIQEYVHRIGRTARIGHVGVATSLYNDRNEDIAPMLVKLLMETGHDIPDFLQAFKPEEGAPLDFEDDSDTEGANGGAANGAASNDGDAWGSGDASGEGDARGSGNASGGDAWGAGNSAAPAADESSW